MNDGNTGYPWSTGDVLLAADLNAAIGNAAAFGTALMGKTIGSDLHQAVGDYTTLAGPVSWSGVTVTIAGANFSASDVGKTLIMPAGGGILGADAPAIVTITSGNGQSCSVSPPVVNAFSALTNIVGGPNATPWNIDVAAPGAGGSFIGDVLTLVAPAIRPAAVQVIQTTVLNATILPPVTGTGSISDFPSPAMTISSVPGRTVYPGGLVQGAGVAPGTQIIAQLTADNPGEVGGAGTYSINIAQAVPSTSLTISYAGSNGPVGAVLLRGTTGYGRRVVLSGTVDTPGTLLPTLTLDPAMGADPGAYWFDVNDPNGEPLRADPQKITYPARWNTVDPVLTLDSGQVSSLVMPSLHVGSSVFATDDNNQIAFPPHTTVTHVDGPSMTATLSAAATFDNGGSGPRNVDFNDNKHELTFTATFLNNSTTINATAALPAGVVVGQVIYGPGLSGGGDPTNPAAGTTITNIAGTTLTISQPTVHAATSAVTLHAVPYLAGVVVKLNLAPAVLAFKDWGAYTGAPGTSGVPFATTRAGAPTDITLLIDNPMRTAPVAISFGTDNTSQINAWLTDVKNMTHANSGGVEAILRPGSYLTLGTINARNIDQNSVTLRVSGVRIHSAAKGLRAWDASGAFGYRMVGDFVVNGDQLFPPDIGMVFAWSNTQLRCNGVSLRDVSATGWFSFASVIMANAEGFHVINMQSGNAMPWPTPVDPTNPDWHPTFGKVIDGDNSYNKLDGPPHNTHGSFVGFLEDNGASNCNGGAIPFSVIGCGGYINRAGYAASWSTPAIFFSKTGPSDLDIHCEVETLTDAVFLWDRNNGVASFSGSTFKDHACYATNSVFSYDHLAKFGVHIAAFNATNCRVAVGPQHNNMQVFDDHSAFAGGLAWHGDISVGGVLKTYAPHWVRNFPDDREGLLLLGDDKTNYNADVVNTSTLIVGNTIQANGDITSENGSLYGARGLVLGIPGFPQGGVTFDGATFQLTKPISLPSASVAVTQAPGDNDTSVATTAFVQAAFASLSTSFVYTATGATTAISAQNRATHHYSVQDFGAKLDGTTVDNAAYAAARTAAKAQSGSGGGGVVRIGPGRQNVNSYPTFSAPPVLWKIDGLTSPAGTAPITSITPGDVVESFFNGTRYWSRTDAAGASPTPLLRLDYTGHGTPIGALTLNFVQSNNGTVFPFGIVSNMTLNQTGTGQAVGITSVVTRTTGSTNAFALYTSINDRTGKDYPGDGNGSVCYEMDLQFNGKDAVTSVGDPNTGSRLGLLIAGITSLAAAWQPNHAYTVPTPIQPTTPNGFVYVLTVAGTSGAVEPTWPTAAGTVTDGTCTWAYGTTIKTQIARGIQVTGRAGQDVSFGAGLLLSGKFYDAAIEISTGTLDLGVNPNAAGIRLAANMPIDWSGDGTTAHQNQRTTGYNSSTTRWSYKLGTVEYLAVADNGSVITGRGSAGATTDTGGHLLIPFCAGPPTGVPVNAALGIALRYDTTSHKLWAYDNGASSWKGVALT